MFNKKLKQEIKSLKMAINYIQKTERTHWSYIKALLDAEKQNRKDLNTVIAKINQMKPKGKK